MATSAPRPPTAAAQGRAGIHFYYPPLEELLPALCRRIMNWARLSARAQHTIERGLNMFELVEQLF
jgi:hypothetical protein